MPPPFTVGRGPVPRRASVGETALVCMRFLRGSGDRGGQAPALRVKEGVFLAMRRSGSGDPELRSYLANLGNLVNPAHILLIFLICNFNLTKRRKNSIIYTNV